MTKTLVVVESPAKAKTIKKYLGKDFEVLASYGHVRDLLPKSGAVEPDKQFLMHYEVIEKNKRHLSAIDSALKNADRLLLATDPDREGEAISWHIYEYLHAKGSLKNKEVARVVFHEITQRAIKEAVDHPRPLAMSLVNAQQARRALDYLVGFNLSPLLWKKVRPSLSAGRVQSPALRLICEREDEINAFVSQEYWSIHADLISQNIAFSSKLTLYAGEKVKQFSFINKTQADEAVATLTTRFSHQLTVLSVDKKQRQQHPAAPFTTSTLQQEASRKLGFSAIRTMRTAQSLYEGINIGHDTVGLITYMRTDAVTLSEEALQDIRQYIGQHYAPPYLPASAKYYKTKSKNAQEAHEAIRPTATDRTPDSLKTFLSSDQYRLYELIWKRTLACQMSPALLDTLAINLGDQTYQVRANGSTIAFDGFLAVYKEDVDDAKKDDDDDRLLPTLKAGEQVNCKQFIGQQHFTEPPPRFSEASLVKTLEEYGIGRPSTYATIISTLQTREYVTMDNRRFIPTDIGQIVSKFLSNHFTRYVDYGFTANLEDDLDAIARDEKNWIPVLDTFWQPFIQLCQEKEQSVSRAEVAQARELGTDPKSGKPVSVRMGRYGPFAQIGDKETEEKPLFASLLSHQRLESITLEEALALFRLPRELGTLPTGEVIKANIGRFGPYIQYGKTFVSLKTDDPYTIELERALEVIEAHKAAQAAKFIKAFETANIQILNGRFGPYVTDGNKNVKVPKDTDPEQLSLEDCQSLLANAPDKKGRASKTKSTTKKNTTTTEKKKAVAKSKTPKKTAEKAPTKKRQSKKTEGTT